MKTFSIALVLAGVFVSPVYGQARIERRDRPDVFVLEGSGSRIGVSARDLDAQESEKFKVPGGVYVEDVRPESPAARAGFKTSDVITEFDGERVRSLRQFTRLVRETPPGRQVKATVMRDGRRTELSVTPERAGGEFSFDGDALRNQIDAFTARIPDFNFDFNFDFDQFGTSRGRLGVTVQELTPDLAAYFGAKNGVLVASVASDSPASRAGLKAGDVIASVNGRTISSRTDLLRELRAVQGPADVTLGIVRDKKETSLTAKIDVQPERRARPFRQARPIRRTA